jgi:hypothetical protein
MILLPEITLRQVILGLALGVLGVAAYTVATLPFLALFVWLDIMPDQLAEHLSFFCPLSIAALAYGLADLYSRWFRHAV